MSLPTEISRETVAACMAKSMSEFDIGYAYPEVSLVTIIATMGVIKAEAEKAKAAKQPETKKAA